MHRLISLPSTDVCVKWGGGVKSKVVVAMGSGHVACSDVESSHRNTVLLLTLSYVHELGIGRLLFVYTRLLQKGDAKM
jgi:hypothetical protein